MPTGEIPKISTTRDLAEFHKSRARAYKRLAELLRQGGAADSDSNLVRCNLPTCEARVRAFQAASVRPGACASEIDALGVLAGSTAAAFGAGNLDEAAELDDVQRRFLSNHAAACLIALTQRLENLDGATGLKQVGRALRRLLDDEARLLGYAAKP